MKAIFFEWDDYDDLIVKKRKIELPSEVELDTETFALEKAHGFQAISIKSFSRISNDQLDKLKESGCEMILLRIAGFNMLDVEYADEIGIKVYRVAAYSPESIAEYAISMMLNLARRHNVQRRQHQSQKNERDADSMGILLHGKTLGLHGYGKIARHVAKIARDGLGMKVLFFDPYFKGESPDTQVESLPELYSQSNIVSIHVPLTEDTKGSVNRELLEQTPEEFILINTARGPIVNTQDAKDLLKSGRLTALGVDVWGDDDHFDPELLRDNAFQSYHIAFFSEESVYQMITQTLESLRGEPRDENKLPISYG